MRKLMFLLKKELRQIRRDPLLSRAIIMVPIIQMLILIPAVNLEVKKIDLAIADSDHSPASRELLARLTGSSFFNVSSTADNYDDAEQILLKGSADMVLFIPEDFSEGLSGAGIPRLQVLSDAVNATSAQLGWAYFNAVVRDYNREIIINKGIAPASIPGINISTRYWYNETLNYKFYMLPGVLVILITAIGLLMAGLNLVKEKEMGTIEQINVTPVKKWQLIASKVIPFFIIGLLDLALGLIIGWILFGIPFEGSLLLFFACAAIFLIAVLGLALFFSSMASTQQQFLFIAFFFVMIFVLMSGIFTPAESMPRWAQDFNYVNPVAYLMRINRMVMLKGSGFHDIARDMGALAVLAFSFISFAIWTYRKRA